MRNEYYVEFPKEEQNILDNSKVEEETSGSIVQFVRKLSEACRVLNLKRNNEEMLLSKVWKRKKIGMLIEKKEK